MGWNRWLMVILKLLRMSLFQDVDILYFVFFPLFIYCVIVNIISIRRLLAVPKTPMSFYPCHICVLSNTLCSRHTRFKPYRIKIAQVFHLFLLIEPFFTCFNQSGQKARLKSPFIPNGIKIAQVVRLFRKIWSILASLAKRHD